MSLCVYSIRLCNHTGMVVLCAFHSCWRLFTFNQIQLDAYCAVVWRWFEATFKLRPGIPIFEKKVNDWVSKKTMTTNLNRNHMAYPTLFHAVSTQSARSVSYRFFFRLCASSIIVYYINTILKLWGGNTPQGTNYMATFLPSRKLYKLDEPDTQDTAGEARTNSSVMYSYGPPHMAKQKQDDQLEHTYSSYVRIKDVALKTCQKR